ncbi:MAG: 30S ribosomal protein S20, partial [Candidatus Aminicenantes bacterium]|nr:30S ribosomal protein S20 [Candidatus Aminicenantes bacterium]
MNKTKMRNQIKKFKKEIEEGKMEEAKSMFPKVISIIDKSNTKGTIHKKTASRYKSRLTALLNNPGS